MQVNIHLGWAYALFTRISSFPPLSLAMSALQRAMLFLSVTSGWTVDMPFLSSAARTSVLRAVAMTWRPCMRSGSFPLALQAIGSGALPLEWNSTARAWPMPPGVHLSRSVRMELWGWQRNSPCVIW